jgi:hypothetical protein
LSVVARFPRRVARTSGYLPLCGRPESSSDVLRITPALTRNIVAALADTRSQLSHRGRVTPGVRRSRTPSRADGLTRERPRRNGHRSTSYVLRRAHADRPCCTGERRPCSAFDRSATPPADIRRRAWPVVRHWCPGVRPSAVPPHRRTSSVDRSAPPPAGIRRLAWPVVRHWCPGFRPSAVLPHRRTSHQQSRFSGRRPSRARERCTYYGIRSVKRREVRRWRGVGRYPEGRRPTPACAGPSFGRGPFGGRVIRRRGVIRRRRSISVRRRSFGGQVRRFTAD